MIEAVSTLSVQSAALRANTQSSASFVASTPAPRAPDMGFLSIRMDDTINKAILEYKSSEGEVIRQYPSESQIRAFQRSSELQQKRAEAASAEAQAVGAAPSVEISTPAATPTQAIEPPSSTANLGGTGSYATSSQSVLV